MNLKLLPYLFLIFCNLSCIAYTSRNDRGQLRELGEALNRVDRIYSPEISAEREARRRRLLEETKGEIAPGILDPYVSLAQCEFQQIITRAVTEGVDKKSIERVVKEKVSKMQYAPVNVREFILLRTDQMIQGQ